MKVAPDTAPGYVPVAACDNEAVLAARLDVVRGEARLRRAVERATEARAWRDDAVEFSRDHAARDRRLPDIAKTAQDRLAKARTEVDQAKQRLSEARVRWVEAVTDA